MKFLTNETNIVIVVSDTIYGVKVDHTLGDWVATADGDTIEGYMVVDANGGKCVYPTSLGLVYHDDANAPADLYAGGYTYIDGVYTKVTGVADPLTSAQDTKQKQNTDALADWLTTHTVTWNGKEYGVSLEDQTLMALNLTQYDMAIAAGQTAALQWHAKKEGCVDFTREQYVALSLTVSAYVQPYLRYEDSIKVQVYADTVTTLANLDSIVIDYSTVVVPA